MSIVNTAMTAVVSALSAAPAVAPQVARVFLRPLSASASTAVVVRPVSSEVQGAPMSTGQPYAWDTTLVVECYARAVAATSVDAAVDALVASVYQRLMSDATLGGAVLLLQPQGVTYDFDVDGQQTVCATFQFVARQAGGATF